MSSSTNSFNSVNLHWT